MEKAEVLSKYFSSVFTAETPGEQPSFNDRPFMELLADISFDEYSIEKKLNSLKVNKSPAPDQLHPRLLKYVLVSTTEIFLYVHGQRQNP